LGCSVTAGDVGSNSQGNSLIIVGTLGGVPSMQIGGASLFFARVVLWTGSLRTQGDFGEKPDRLNPLKTGVGVRSV
jgi:hypothetical protein